MKNFNKSIYDTSDLILKTFNDLKDSMPEKIKNQISNHYLNHEYEDAIKLFEQIDIKDNKKIIADLRDNFKSAKENDKPQTNYSRRYFETILSSYKTTGTEISEGESSSFIKFAKFLNKTSPELYKKDTDNEDIKIVEDSGKVKGLKIERIDKIADKVREYEDGIPRITELRDSIRENKESLYNNKDRSKDKKDPKSKPLSRNPGVMTANQPSYRDQLLDEAKIGKPVDTHYIGLTKNKKPGFSAENKNVPFVNSLSGTTYGLVALLSEYMEQHKGDPKLEEDVNNIIKYNVSFRMKNGFHSYQEMHSVFNDKVVEKIFQKYEVKINDIFETKPVLNAMENAYEYSQDIIKKRAINAELAKLNFKDFRLDNAKNISPTAVRKLSNVITGRNV